MVMIMNDYSETKGVIRDIFYPDYLNCDIYKLDVMGFKVELENGDIISFVCPRTFKYSSYFKDDMIILSISKVKYSRGEYLEKLKELIDVNYGYLSDEEKKKKYEARALFNTIEVYDIVEMCYGL